MTTRSTTAALRAFRENGGTLRTRDALARGIHAATLYALRDQGKVIELVRGLYRLADADAPENPDLSYVAAKAPYAAVCLISALAYHNITTQIPSAIHLAVPRGSRSSISLAPAPVKIYRYDPKTFELGLKTHHIDGRPVRIYGVARSVVDAFKYRNKIGLDVAIEALHYARERTKVTPAEIPRIARPLRVANVITPYLQATNDY